MSLDFGDLELPLSMPFHEADSGSDLLRKLCDLCTSVVWGCTDSHRSILDFLHGYPANIGIIIKSPSDEREFPNGRIPPTDSLFSSFQRKDLPVMLRSADAWIFFEQATEIVLVTFHVDQRKLLFFWSWGDPLRKVQLCRKNLEQWLSRVSEGIVYPLESLGEKERAEEDLTQIEKSYRINEQTKFSLPEWLELRNYQQDAIRAWLDAKGKGILEMATGAGKTLTALSLACKLAEKNKPFVVIVICPFVSLAEQWVGEMEAFGLRPVRCYHSRRNWEDRLRNQYQALSNGLRDVLSLVVSNATFLSPHFQSRLRTNVAPHLLIADEMHNLGAEKVRNALPKEIQLRLGLSATPDRHGDPEGTGDLKAYFGDVVFRFTLKDAIDKKVLVPYRYHPVLVDLTLEEAETYGDLTRRIAQAWRGDNVEQTDHLKFLLLQRARLIASAANKLTALDSLLAMRDEPLNKALVYCGDGSSEIDGAMERQISAVTRILGEQHQLKVRKFTYEETAEERADILTALKQDDLDAVVAMRCLDEGIDVPDVRTGFLLASSTNPRQFIQRRGRLLRRAAGKEHADIFDFIVCPPCLGDDFDDETFNLERRAFARELGRIHEFCETAENGPTALKSLQDLRIQYNLLAI